MRKSQDRSQRTSGKIAKARTKLTIASDRLDCNQEELSRMQEEVMDLLVKYMNLGRESYEIKLQIITRTKRGVKNVKTIQIK